MDGRMPRPNQSWNPGPSSAQARPRYADNEPSSSVNPVSYPQPMYRGPSAFHNNVSSMRAAFADNYGISGSQAEASSMYQPAESSYQHQRDVAAESFGDVSTGNGGEYPVHQLVVDADRVLGGNRVISPVVDSTVGQSGLSQSVRRHVAVSDASNVPHSSGMLHSVSSSQSFMQPTSMATYSQAEVSTTGGTMAMMAHASTNRDVTQAAADDMETAVSSMNGPVDEFPATDSASSSKPRKPRKKRNSNLDEPDTTQGDDDDYQPNVRDYMSDDSDMGAQNGVNEGPAMRTDQPLPQSHSQPEQSEPRPGPSSSSGNSDMVYPRQPSANMSMRSIKINAAPASGHIGPELLAATQNQNYMGMPADQNRSSCQFVNSVPASGHMVQAHLLPQHLQMQQLAASGSLPQPHLNTQSSMMPSINLMVEASMFGPTSTMDERAAEMHTYMVPLPESKLDSTMMGSQSETVTSETQQRHLSQYVETSDSSMQYPQRKSKRLKELELEGSMYRKPNYHNKVYNPDHLWCDECYDFFEGECPVHKLTALPDKVVFSRAWASLPQALQIFRLGDKESEDEEVELGVFARRTIQKFTQFGPFVAEMVDSRAKLSQDKFILTVERPDGSIVHYETSDENKCNWMMFVRPAKTYTEQNLVAYQHGQDIYFTVTRPIDVKAELKVWYAAHYAERWGFPRLEITDSDVQAMEEQMSKFQCYECPKRFKTASALQKHLQVHEEPCPSTSNEESQPVTSEVEAGDTNRKKKLLQYQSLLRKKAAAKKIKDFASGEGQALTETNGNAANYHWKKRSTNIYLNKTLKKYQLRFDAEALRRTVQSMYRKGEDEDGNEWVCNSCDLTFDNSNLLNLHTLTHAAEDVGLDEVRKFTYQGDQPDISTSELVSNLDLANIVSLGQPFLACPVCQAQFDNKKDLIEHAAEHGRSKSSRLPSYNRPFKCELCWKSFATIDRLQKHQLCHGDEESKPMQCTVCNKRFMNNSALACHMKTHSTGKYYECPICHEGFDQTGALREHSLIHASSDGLFNCPHCDKRFSEFLVLKKHVRGNHTNRFYPCPDCEKIFPRQDKLRLHMLRHSTVREFMCESCGRQFKRKDKLKEHMKRMHSDERKEKDRLKALKPSGKKFIPKVLPTEYHRFIYKCHLCMLGFKRRGMLVNHIAKRHPDVKPTSIPELNLPILKTQRDYYCQYCDKVYKSSSKRKAHILKNHPGAELPLSSRKKIGSLEEVPGIPNPTYSQTVGSITTMPQQCEYCHKQYASKAKLLQHQRKKHSDIVPPLPDRHKRGAELITQIQQEVAQSSGETAAIHVLEGDQAADSAQSADILTQAMNELTQTLKEYQQTAISSAGGEGTFLSARLASAPMVQIQTAGSGQATSTIELSQLNQALQQFAPGSGGVPIQVQVSGAPSPIQIPLLTTSRAGETVSQAHIVTVDQLASTNSTPPPSSEAETTSASQQISFPINIVTAGAYVPKSWTNYTYKQE